MRLPSIKTHLGDRMDGFARTCETLRTRYMREYMNERRTVQKKHDETLKEEEDNDDASSDAVTVSDCDDVHVDGFAHDSLCKSILLSCTRVEDGLVTIPIAKLLDILGV
jgi:hypothetical protein